MAGTKSSWPASPRFIGSAPQGPEPANPRRPKKALTVTWTPHYLGSEYISPNESTGKILILCVTWLLALHLQVCRISLMVLLLKPTGMAVAWSPDLDHWPGFLWLRGGIEHSSRVGFRHSKHISLSFCSSFFSLYILSVTSLWEMLEANRKRKTCRLRTKTSRRRRRGGKNWWKKSFFTANCLKSWFFVRLTIGIYRCVTHTYIQLKRQFIRNVDHCLSWLMCCETTRVHGTCETCVTSSSHGRNIKHTKSAHILSN